VWSLVIVRLTVTAHPNARQDRVQLLEDGAVAVWVRARPIAGAANAAIESTLARALGLRPRQVAVTAGHTARRKTVSIEVEAETEVWARLRAAAQRTR
jgi:uncharacterized protein YggU (UPF0235/DUF167 family)